MDVGANGRTVGRKAGVTLLMAGIEPDSPAFVVVVVVAVAVVQDGLIVHRVLQI